MQKKGKLYTVILISFVIILLLVAYVQLVQFYAKDNNYSLTKNIGGKQGAILTAVQEGERVSLYIHEAAILASIQASSSVHCGEPYLGRTLISLSSICDAAEGNTEAFAAAFNRQLLLYPGRTLRNAEWKDISTDEQTTTIEGTVRIPLIPEPEAQQQQQITTPFTGSYGGWPTPYRLITSYFGNRDIGGAASKNHPGLDISTNGQRGVPVTALGSGEASYTPDPKNYAMYITIKQDDGAILDYMHIEALERAAAPNEIVIPVKPDSVRVEAGQVIGRSAAIDAPHLHLQVRYPTVDSVAVESVREPAHDGQAWTAHVGPSDRLTAAEPSYAVTRVADKAAFLNPICFFERSMMQQIVQDSTTANGNDDLEQRRRSMAFTACDQYSVLGLEGTLLGTAAPTSEEQQAQEIPAPSEQTEEIQKTAANIQRLQLMPHIEEAASESGVDPRLMLAIITQESQGDETAISPTGPAGIAQFSADTARGYFDEADRNSVVACCRAGETGPACQNQAQNLCDENTDPRFDPVKSVDAQAKFLRENYEHYNSRNYEQHIAFAIAAYNGGQCPVDYVLAQLGGGTTLTWDQVHERMLSYASSGTMIRCRDDNYLPDWQQIADYGTLVLRWYEAWGGVTFAGTPFSSESIGYYDLAVRVEQPNPIIFSQVLRDAQRAAQRCTTQACIDSAITATRPGVSVRRVELAADAPICMEPAEAALAYYSNQVAWCLSSPDSDCNCELQTGVDAVVAVSASQMQLQQLSGNNIQTPPMLGFEGERHGDHEDEFFIEAHNSLGVLRAEQATWRAQQQELLIGGDTHSVGWLYKRADGDGLAFTNVPRESCVLPPKPVAYCIEAHQHQPMRAVVYIDNTLSSEPTVQIADLRAVQTGPEHARITFSAESYPYVHVIAHGVEGDEHLYLNVHDAAPGLNVQEFQRTAAGEYEAAVPYAPQYSVSLMDAYLHEASPERTRTDATSIGGSTDSGFDLQ